MPTNVYSGVESITADSTGIFNGFSMGYLYGTNADYGLDGLVPVTGLPLAHSQDDLTRTVYYDSGTYRTIASSAFFGALADGQNGNTKANVMMQYLSFLMGEPRPDITASVNELDFGITYPDVVYNLEVEVSNTGLDTLFITDISTSGEGYLYTGTTELILLPSEMQLIELSFETDQIGQYPGELTINSDDPDTPELVILLSSECVLPPAIVCDPSFIDIELGSNDLHQEFLTISNLGGYELICELTIGDSTQTINWLDIVQDSCLVQPGDEEDIILIFDPNTLENGQYQTEIMISHNDPDQEMIIIPITMSLSITDADDDFVISSDRLIGNYPNPFNPVTTISFAVTESTENTEIIIYNLKGQKIRQLLNDQLSAGLHSVVWNGKNDNDNTVSAGIYFYKLRTDHFVETKKMILLK